MDADRSPFDISAGNVSYTPEQLDRHRKYLDTSDSEEAVADRNAEKKERLKEAFLTLISKGANVTQAVKVINDSAIAAGGRKMMSRATPYVWRREDPLFLAAWQECYDIATDEMEIAAWNFALGGNPSMMQFFLKSRNPQLYNPALKFEKKIEKNVAVSFTFKLDSPKDERLDFSDESDEPDDKTIDGNFRRIAGE